MGSHLVLASGYMPSLAGNALTSEASASSWGLALDSWSFLDKQVAALTRRAYYQSWLIQ